MEIVFPISLSVSISTDVGRWGRTFVARSLGDAKPFQEEVIHSFDVGL